MDKNIFIIRRLHCKVEIPTKIHIEIMKQLYRRNLIIRIVNYVLL